MTVSEEGATVTDAAARDFRALPRRGVHRAPGALRALVVGATRPDGRVPLFEREVAIAFGVRDAIAVGSGRLALALLLRALDLRPGDEVLVPALTFHAVPDAIVGVGLKPVLVDVDPDSLGMDPADAVRKVGPRTRVVLATHLFGVPCDVHALIEVCARRDLILVEDFAQAAGAVSAGRPCGSIGRAAFTSLETVKPLCAFGGGIVTTSEEEIAMRVRAFARELPPPDPARLLKKIALGEAEALVSDPRFFGMLGWRLVRGGDSEAAVARYKARKREAGNHRARIHPAQAEAGRASLRDLPDHLRARADRAARLHELLPATAWRQAVGPDDRPSWYMVVARVRDAGACARAAIDAGIDVGRAPVSDVSHGACRRSAAIARELVQLPCHPGLSDDDLARVAAAVRPWLVS